MTNFCGIPVNWAATSDLVSALGSLLTGCAALLAVQTFKAWRRQKIEERHIQHAENILSAVYRAENNLHEIRDPFHTIMDENKARLKLEADGLIGGLQGEDLKRRITTQVIFQRVADSNEGRMAIYRALPAAKTFWGAELEAPLRTMLDQYVKIVNYASEHDQFDTYLNNDKARERQRLIKAALYRDEKDQGDEISHAVKQAVAKIETVCRPVLKGTKGADRLVDRNRP